MYWMFFFFQAEDGIRDLTVTGVQTCALPICAFVPQVLRKVRQRGAGGPAAPVKREAGEAPELMGRHIAEQQRQFFLEGGAQEPGQLAALLCQLRIAAAPDLSPLETRSGCLAGTARRA